MERNAALNGANGATGVSGALKRFSYLPQVLDISIDQDSEVVGIDLQEELLEDPTELCTLLENESVQRGYWISIATAYAKQNRVDSAIDFLKKGQQAFQAAPAGEQLSFLNALIWMYLWKARETPVSLSNDLAELYNEMAGDPDTKMNGMYEQTFGEDEGPAGTRQQYLLAAKRAINEAMRLDPRSIPLTLARATLMLIEANQMQDAPIAPGQRGNPERAKRLQEAYNTFDAAYKAAGSQYIPAVFGKARAQFMMGRYANAYASYQEILRRAPHQVDPDPRIGIGSCLWQLGHYDDARAAWERALEVNPGSKAAHIYLGIYWLHSSYQYAPSDPKFSSDYKKAISNYIMKAFKLDEWFPLSCSTLASYFMIRQQWANGQKLAHRAIRGTDVKSIASDSWFLIGRSKHAEGELDDALTAYKKAEELRGGDEAGYLPAKLGIAQILLLESQLESTPSSERARNMETAKTMLEQMVKAKSLEASELLGTVLAEEVFNAEILALGEDKTKEKLRAIALLEQVRTAWNDPKKHMSPDSSVLLNLARLYEADAPEKSYQCLAKVEEMEINNLPDELKPEGVTNEVMLKAALREYLPPQLLNNMGCFLYQNEKYEHARDLFQTALNACVKIGDQDPSNDTDALVTSISYNLARCYEAENMLDDAEKIYKGLLTRHPEYTDGNARLAYIRFKKDPRYQGPDSIESVYQANKDNLEVRALYGWWCNKVKRRTLNVAEDQEQRFYKVTLQQYDKHDVYSLTGMGNIYLQIAREMKKESDEDRARRRKMYEKAVEFYDKAVQYDPHNAYAAQGIGIAMAEDKKEFPAAIQIFTKVREAIKEPSVYINLGHVYCELKQYSRAVECYEQALAKVTPDQQVAVLLYLGRVWAIRGKTDRQLNSYKTSLEYTRKAQELNPAEITIRFNVAFVQYQIAQHLITLNVAQRTLQDVLDAQKGLDDAITSFREIAKAPNPPYPKSVIESRANMSQNTMKKQLERAASDQREFEGKNAARLAAAREAREAEIKKREDEKRERERQEEERRQKLLEERRAMQERDRELAEKRAEEERRKEEELLTTDAETGERKKREKKKSKPRGEGKRGKKSKERVGTEDELSGLDGADGTGSRSRSRTGSAEPGSRKRKRKLQTRSKGKQSALSAEFVNDSDLDDEEPAPAGANGHSADGDDARLDELPDSPMKDVFGDEDDGLDHDDEDEEEEIARPRKKTHVRVVNEDDDDDEE